MLLPRNVERRQWVSRYYRIKVLLNVADDIYRKYECLRSTLYSAKTQRVKKALFCMLNFAEIKEGDIIITMLGKEFVEADIEDSKTIFKNQIKNISTFRVIENVLNSKRNKTMKEEFFKELFMQHFSTYEVEETMGSIIDWGRYAEVFNYDHDSEELFLENEVNN